MFTPVSAGLKKAVETGKQTNIYRFSRLLLRSMTRGSRNLLNRVGSEALDITDIHSIPFPPPPPPFSPSGAFVFFFEVMNKHMQTSDFIIWRRRSRFLSHMGQDYNIDHSICVFKYHIFATSTSVEIHRGDTVGSTIQYILSECSLKIDKKQKVLKL